VTEWTAEAPAMLLLVEDISENILQFSVYDVDMFVIESFLTILGAEIA
jgi:hypothetical protein